jgi:hypothetical protein
MSAKNCSAFLVTVLSVFISFNSTANAGEKFSSWEGVIEDLNGYHSPRHSGDHPLKFTRASDGESFLIVEGEETLLKDHLRSDKTQVVQIDGRLTSKFLFFGGNMVVEQSKAIRDLASVEHRKVSTGDNTDRPRGRSSR